MQTGLAFGSGSTAEIEDLNGDGIKDRLVMPGLGYSAANVEMAVFLSKDGCVSEFAASFSASDVSVTEDGSLNNGLRDLEARNINGPCTLEVATYQFDGDRYLVNSELDRRLNICPDKCMSDDKLIAAARAELSASPEPPFGSFAAGSVTSIPDLNGDKYDDFIVLPGIEYAGTNVETVIYVSNEQGCPTSYAGWLGAYSEVYPTADAESSMGLRNLRAVNRTSCVHFFQYGDDGYQVVSEEEYNACE